MVSMVLHTISEESLIEKCRKGWGIIIDSGIFGLRPVALLSDIRI